MAKISKKKAEVLSNVPTPKKGFLSSLFTGKSAAEKSIDEKAKELMQKEKHLRSLEEEILKKKAALNQHEEKLLKLRSELDQKSTYIDEKAKGLQEIVKKLTAEADDMHKQKEILSKEITELAGRRSKLSEEVKGSEDILRKAKDLERMQGDLARRESDLVQKKQSVESLRSDLSQKEKSFSERESRLQTQETEAMRKQRDTTNEIIRLTTDKQLLVKDIGAKRAEFQNVSTTFDEKMSLIRAEEKLLAEKEDQLLARVKELEKDRSILDDKEQELLDQVKMIDVDKDVNRKKAAEIRAKVAELERAGNDTRLREEKIADRENEIVKKGLFYGKQKKLLEEQLEKIRNVQELKIDTDRLKRMKESMTKQLNLEQEKFKKLATDLVKKSKELSEKEQLLAKKEKSVSQREQMTMSKEERISSLKGELESEKVQLQDLRFRSFISKELSKYDEGPEAELVSAELEEEHPTHYKLLEKIEDARNSLNAGNVDGAKKLYQQLGMMFSNVPEGDEKKRMYYQILELKSDIELAMLR